MFHLFFIDEFDLFEEERRECVEMQEEVRVHFLNLLFHIFSQIFYFYLFVYTYKLNVYTAF